MAFARRAEDKGLVSVLRRCAMYRYSVRGVVLVTGGVAGRQCARAGMRRRTEACRKRTRIGDTKAPTAWPDGVEAAGCAQHVLEGFDGGAAARS